MTALKDLPIAVIGGGPVGLAAVAHLLDRGLPVKLYESGTCVGANVRDWGHVRVFTPWRYCVDAVAAKFLEGRGWRVPALDAFPTGDDLLRKEAMFILAAGFAEAGELDRAIDLGCELANLDYNYKNIGGLLEAWQAKAVK